MNDIKFEDMVRGLVKHGSIIQEQLTPMKTHMLHMSVGIAGEAGELVDCLKKYAIYGQELDTKNLIEELGDIEFYLEGLRESLNITREETLQANIEKLGKRYEGLKYTDAAAKDRADKKVG